MKSTKIDGAKIGLVLPSKNTAKIASAIAITLMVFEISQEIQNTRGTAIISNLISETLAGK